MSEAVLSSLLSPLFPSLDSALLSYLSSILLEASPKKWTSSRQVFDTIGELLESYEAVGNEKEGKEKCEQLFVKMQEKGIIQATVAKPAAASSSSASSSSALKHPTPISTAIPTASPSPSSSPNAPVTGAAPASAAPAKNTTAASSSSSSSAASSSSSTTALPHPGYTCHARYSGDGLFYRALVLSVKTIPVVRVRVRFIEYGDEEEVALTALKDIKEGVMPVERKGKRAERKEGDAEGDDSDDDSDDDEDAESTDKPGKLLSAVRIGELGPSAAAKRLEERSQAQIEAEKNLTPKEQKRLAKMRAKAEEAARATEASRQWNPNSHRQALASAALPIYLESQHLSKKSGTKDIAIDDVQLLSPDNTELLSNSELRLVYGRKYGLIGRNGIGKSTLLRAISTYSIPKFPTYIKIMHVEQEVIAENISVLEVVMNSDLERGMLLKEEKECNEKLKELEAKNVEASSSSSSSSSATLAPSTAATALTDRLTSIYERLNEMESHTALTRASTILNGLQFSTEMQAMPTRALSGGWRMRVALACALFVSPDLLLLDEPTNHLDYPAVLWLTSYLQSYPKTVLIVSHDRVFLNSVITDIVFFNNKKSLEYFRGNYDSFLVIKAERYKQEKRAYESQQMQKEHLQEYITTFKTEKKSAAQARKVGQAMSKQKILDKMELLPNPDEESFDKFSLKFPEPTALRQPLIAEIRDLNFKYPKREFKQTATNGGTVDGDANAPVQEDHNMTAQERAEEEERRIKRQKGLLTAAVVPPAATTIDPAQPYLLEGINVKIDLGVNSRIGILGANGCGKSTLIKILLGELPTQEGLVWLNSNVRIAYFTQHHIDQLNLGLTAVQWLKELFHGTTDTECRRHLGRFGLLGEMTMMQIGNLSGGQKSRLAFAIICWKEPHMLIMDEPTNHLDHDTIESLITAINEFKGAVLIISHDQHFLEGCMKQFWSIHERKLQVFDSLEACKKATYKHIGE